jgi:nucleotide-binding universal stress UspA family protein
MFKRIVLALDGSELSEQSIPFARTLAFGLELPMDLLQIVESKDDQRVPSGSSLMTRRFLTDLEHAATTYLRSIRSDLTNDGVSSIRVLVKRGAVEEEIVRGAGDDPASLLVMTSHGTAGISRWNLGSATNHVIRHSKAPVMVIRALDQGEPARAMNGLQRIVIPLDGSEIAEAIERIGVDLASALSIPLTLLRVIPSGRQYQGYIPRGSSISNMKRNEVQSYLDSRVESNSSARIPSITTAVREGDIAEQILEFASSIPGTLVAMTTHGRSGVQRWTLGSIADRVMRHSTEPVIILSVRPEDKGRRWMGGHLFDL